MQFRRQLDPSEKSQLGNRYIAFAAEYRGRLDAKLLNQSLDLLCIEHPILCGIIDTSGDGFIDCERRSKNLQIIEIIGDLQKLRNSLVNISNENFSDGNYEVNLAYLVLARESTEHGYVVLLVSHAIVDAPAYLSITRDLWEIYSKLSHGQKIASRSNAGLPAPPSELLQNRFGKNQKTTNKPSKDGIAKLQNALHYDFQNSEWVESVEKNIVLQKLHLARLVSIARESSISLNSLLCGLLLTAHNNAHDRIINDAIMLFTSNIRTRVEPHITPTETTNFCSGSSMHLPIDVDSTPISLGRQIESKMESIIRERKYTMFGNNPLQVLEGERIGELSCIFVSNVGKIDLLPQANGLKIESLSLLSLTDDAPPKWRHGNYAIYTYDGVMKIDCLYPKETSSGCSANHIHLCLIEELGQLVDIPLFES